MTPYQAAYARVFSLVMAGHLEADGTEKEAYKATLAAMEAMPGSGKQKTEWGNAIGVELYQRHLGE